MCKMTEKLKFKILKDFFGEVKKEKRGIAVVMAVFLQSVFRMSLFYLYGLLIGKFKTDYDTPMLQLTMIGLLPSFLKNFFSFVPTILTRRIGRNGEMWMAVASTLLVEAGLLTSSFVPSPPWMFLTYSFICGSGDTFGCSNGLILTCVYFPKGHKHHVLALAINSFSRQIASILTPVLALLISLLGWRDTFRTLAAIHFCTMLPLCLLFKTPENNYSNLDIMELEDSKKEMKESELINHKNENNDRSNYQATNQGTNGLIVLQGNWNSKNAQGSVDSTTNHSQDEATEDSKISKTLKLSNILHQAGQRREIIFWWIAVFFFAITYGSNLFLAPYFESFGYTMLEASNFIAVASLAGTVINALGCVMGRIFEGRLIYVHVLASISLSIVCLIWPLVHGNKPYHFAMSSLFGAFNALNRLFLYPCSQEVTGLETDVAISSTMFFAGIGIIVAPILTGGIYDLLESYKACLISISSTLLINFLCYCLIVLMMKIRRN